MQKRTRSEFVRDLKIGSGLIVLAHATLIAMLVAFGSGCATAPQKPAEQIRTQETLKGLVRIQQMGNDCSDQEGFLRQIVKEMYFQNGLPEPAIVKLAPLAGSSICGFAQGMANLATMPELGARNAAVAEVTLYWSAITEQELLRAKTLLAAMRPL